MASVDPKKLKAFIARDSKRPFEKNGRVKTDVEEEEEGDDEKSDEDDEEDDEDEVDAEEIGRQVQAGNGDKHLMKLSKGITDETNPPASITDESIWEKAKEAVKPRWDEYEEPYAVVMHVYEKMGGGFKGGGT